MLRRDVQRYNERQGIARGFNRAPAGASGKPEAREQTADVAVRRSVRPALSQKM